MSPTDVGLVDSENSLMSRGSLGNTVDISPIMILWFHIFEMFNFVSFSFSLYIFSLYIFYSVFVLEEQNWFIEKTTKGLWLKDSMV